MRRFFRSLGIVGLFALTGAAWVLAQVNTNIDIGGMGPGGAAICSAGTPGRVVYIAAGPICSAVAGFTFDGVGSVGIGTGAVGTLTMNSAAGTNAALTETGIDRSSAGAETFTITNSGAGTLTCVTDALNVGTAAQFQVATTGALLFSGVATDITTGTDEALTITIGGLNSVTDGNLVLNSGGTSSPAFFHQVQAAGGATKEVLYLGTVSDISTSGIALANATTTSAQFFPALVGYSSIANATSPGLTLQGKIAGARDTGAVPVLDIGAGVGTSSENYTAVLSNRSPIGFKNFTTLVGEIGPAGIFGHTPQTIDGVTAGQCAVGVGTAALNINASIVAITNGSAAGCVVTLDDAAAAALTTGSARSTVCYVATTGAGAGVVTFPDVAGEAVMPTALDTIGLAVGECAPMIFAGGVWMAAGFNPPSVSFSAVNPWPGDPAVTRAINTVYQNPSNNRPLWVAATTTTANPPTVGLIGLIGPANPPVLTAYFTFRQNGWKETANFMVPPLYYYKVTDDAGATLNDWHETLLK